MVGIFALLLSASTAAAAPTAPTAAPPAPAIKLSQRDVAELILKQSPQAKRVSLLYETKLADVAKARALTDWKLDAETGYLTDRTESLTRFLNDSKTEKMTTTVTLSKSLLTGTTLSLALARDSYKSDQVVGTTPPDVVSDRYTLSLTQDLWANSFGRGTRSVISTAELTYEADMLLRANELEDVVLNGLRLYWNAYVAQESFREALAVRDRYEKLVASVRRKTSVGYNSPGELSQAQAEFENRVQTVKSSSATYLQLLDQLITTLALEPGSEVTFVVPKELPPVPKLDAKSPDSLRILRSEELRLKAAEELVRSTESSSKPTVALVGRVGATGVEETAEASYSELIAGAHPETYVGLRFSYSFGSGTQSETLRANRALLSIAEVRRAQTRSEQQDSITALERKVGSAYAIAQSAARQREYREKAMQELTRTYNQGRTTLKDLIDAMNNYFDSELRTIRTLGDYQVALNEWAAARDELIPDQKESTP